MTDRFRFHEGRSFPGKLNLTGREYLTDDCGTCLWCFDNLWMSIISTNSLMLSPVIAIVHPSSGHLKVWSWNSPLSPFFKLILLLFLSIVVGTLFKLLQFAIVENTMVSWKDGNGKWDVSWFFIDCRKRAQQGLVNAFFWTLYAGELAQYQKSVCLRI